MNTLKINHEYKVGQVVYFMHKNKIRKGVVDSISISAETPMMEIGLIEKIVKKTIAIISGDYPFNINIHYSLNLVSNSGGFESSPHILRECNVYGTQKDIIYDLQE